LNLLRLLYKSEQERHSLHKMLLEVSGLEVHVIHHLNEALISY
jgi:hypothetical protein